MRAFAFAVALFALPCLAFADAPSLDSAPRSASLLGDETLEASYTPSAAAPLRLVDDLRFGASDAPWPLDHGGALTGEGRQVLALLLGLFVGFGIGHLVAGDKDGFVLFLLVDVAIIVVSTVIGVFAHFYFGYLAMLVSHVIQGLDAYAEAGGPRIIQQARERAVRIASAPGREEPAVTTRVFSLAF